MRIPLFNVFEHSFLIGLVVVTFGNTSQAVITPDYLTAIANVTIDPSGAFPSPDEQIFESASAPNMIDLNVGSSNFSEARLAIDSLYSAGLPIGITGSVFAAAVANSGADEGAFASFSYRFLLTETSTYTLTFESDTNDVFFGGITGFSVLDDNFNFVFGGNSTQGILESGFYNLLIDAEAFSAYIDVGGGTPPPSEYNYGQADFTLLFAPIPEPASATLASSLVVILLGSRLRRF